MRTTVFAFALLATIGCNTVPKSRISSIEVPSGLTANQVEFAILAALATDPPPDGLTPQVEITDRALQAWFGWRYQSLRQDSRWFLEARTPGTVTAGFEHRNYYLRVLIVHSQTEVRFIVDGSRNLRESETLIHKSAVAWIQDLEIRIRRSLGHMVIAEDA